MSTGESEHSASPGSGRQVPHRLRGPYRSLGDLLLQARLTGRHLYQWLGTESPEARRVSWDGHALILHTYLGNETLQVEEQQERVVLERSPEARFVRIPEEEAGPFVEVWPLGDRAACPPETVKQLREELEERLRRDQDLRFEFDRRSGGALDARTLSRGELQPLIEEMERVDRDNVLFLGEALRRAGWIDSRRFGPRAARGAMLLLLHSGHVPLMRGALPGVEAEWRSGHLNSIWYASLVDRLRLLVQEPLLYGVQSVVYDDGGSLYPLPADRAALNARRESIGQPPIEQILSVPGAGGRLPRVLVLEE